jgi:phage tail protein X
VNREPRPRVDAMEELEGESDAGALVLDLEEEAAEEGPRLDGVRFARIRVQEGDSVSGIAIRRYGQASATILDLMKLANPNLNDVDVIVVGQTIRLPQLDEAFPILNEGAEDYSLLVYSAAESWRANGLRDELQARGFSASLTRASLGSAKPIYRVVVSGFSSRDEVVDAGKKLQRLFREDRRIAELSNGSR